MANHGWLKHAAEATAAPTESVVGVIRKNMAGMRDGRDRSQLHASDITKPDFCPRQWAIQDLQQVKAVPQYLPTALATTFSMGSAMARLLIEEWSGDAVVGNWKCVRCHSFRSLVTKPKDSGCAVLPGKHIWEYHEVVVYAPKYAVSGALDAVYNLGTPFWQVAELKIMASDEFDKIVAPLPEHRIRTSLYLHLIENCGSSLAVWKNNFNLTKASVIYISRGYGRKNDAWGGEILPFKEFVIKRDDEVTKVPLQKAVALKMFREEKVMPTGICSTAIDAPAKKCKQCQACFSGDHPAKIDWKDL